MRRIALIACTCLLTVVPGARAGTPPAGFTERTVVSGLNQPTAIAFLPSGKMLVTEKDGSLLIVGPSGVQTLIDVPVCTAGEMGLLGVAVDPDFVNNGYIYLYRTKAGPGGCSTLTERYNQVVRVQLLAGAVNPASLTELLSGIRTDNTNHDGGGLRIGPDGKLYASVGDTGTGDVNGPPGSSTNPYAQDLGELEGKILRLELNGAPAAGNPFIGVPGARPEIFAYGFRNPFRFGFDPHTGRLWAGDVGQNSYEELDIVSSGGNYSWPYCEGAQPTGCQQPGDISPIYTYAEGTLGRTIIAGAFAPEGFGSYASNYFFGDYTSSVIYRAVPNAARTGILGGPIAFVTGADGPVDVIFGPGASLYYVAINTGEVRQVSPADDSPASATTISASLVPDFRQTISASQCAARGGLNSNHGAPLSMPSCNPPGYVPGTAARIGPSGIGSATFTAVPGDPSTVANEADVSLALSISDVRSIASGGDYAPNGSGPDVTLTAKLRLSDYFNGPLRSLPSTTGDFQFPVGVNCAPTADPSVGSTCSASTTANAVTPKTIVEGRDSKLQVFRVRVGDSGVNGVLGDSDDRTFAQQGIYVP